MLMRIFVIALVSAALIGCGPSGPDALTTVRMERDELIADQYRRAMECKAQAIELASAPGNVQQTAINGCVEAHQKMLEAEQILLQKMENRIEELSR